MALFQPIDPLRPNAPFLACIDWAARRDPLGHKVHLTIAIIALAMIPLSSSIATIGSSILFVYAALRAPTIWPTWKPLGTNKCVILYLSLLGWLAISLLWSEDPAHGVRLLRGSRYLLLIPALLPLLRHTHLLLAGICGGVLFQNIMQLVGTDPRGGLSEHPGHTALWFTLALSILVLLPSASNQSRNGIVRRVLAVIPMLGIVSSAARATLAGSVLGVGCGMLLALIKRGPDRLAVLVSGSIVLALGLVLSFSPGTLMQSSMQTAIDAVAESDSGDVINHRDNVRPLWWRIGFDDFKTHPITGVGIGSAESSISNDPEVLEITENGTEHSYVFRDDFHSLFVTVAAESGAIGLILLLIWITLLARQILCCGTLDRVLLAALVSFLVYSTLNTSIFTGRLVAFAAILMTFSIVQLPEQVSIRDATSEPT